MFTLIVIPTILLVVAVSLALRLIFRSLWNPYHLRRPYFGPYGYYGYGTSTDGVASPADF